MLLESRRLQIFQDQCAQLGGDRRGHARDGPSDLAERQRGGGIRRRQRSLAQGSAKFSGLVEQFKLHDQRDASLRRELREAALQVFAQPPRPAPATVTKKRSFASANAVGATKGDD